ncbi:MAG: sugar transferase, partial [Chitinivibrionales bacterium]
YKTALFPSTYNPSLELSEFSNPMVILSVAWLILYYFTGLYRDWYKESRIDEFLVVARTVVIGIAVIFLLIAADEIMSFARTGNIPHLLTETQITFLSLYGICMLVFSTGNRFMVHTFLAWMRKRGLAVSKLLIIGANDSGRQFLNTVINYPQLGYEVAGFVDDNGKKRGTEIQGHKVIGTYSELPDIIQRYRISGIVISQVSSSPNEIMKILTYCGDSKVNIYMVPSMIDVITGHFKTHQIFGIPLMVLLQDHMPSWQAQIKRLTDIMVSFSILTAGLPFWILLAIAIKTTSKGPAIYKQERVGKNWKPFVMMKFRSMYEDAETRAGPQWATENDPRITPLGRFLRKTRLDEIPQFINVLKGDMSLVGPRPERKYFIQALKKEIPWYVRRIKMKPGITGWAQVKHKYDETIEDVRQKVLYDLYYFENMSLLLDLKIIIRTIMVVFTGKGAH